tara:strand:- start:333 stop:500 length:168 start_codon:yes stop_codon:yes gene_type:complete
METQGNPFQSQELEIAGKIDQARIQGDKKENPKKIMSFKAHSNYSISDRKVKEKN